MPNEKTGGIETIRKYFGLRIFPCSRSSVKKDFMRHEANTTERAGVTQCFLEGSAFFAGGKKFDFDHPLRQTYPVLYMKTERYRSLAAVYAMVMNERDELLLLRRANTGFCDGYYDMPAGHLEEGEMLRHAVVRELEEETGLKVKEEDAEFVELLHRIANEGRVYLDVFFRIKKWTGEAIIREPDKCDDIGWFPIDSLPENLVPHQLEVIRDRATGRTYREIL